MFTGLVKEKSKVLSKTPGEGGCAISVLKPATWLDLEIGESIAVNGICLTLEGSQEDALLFFAGAETMKKTCVPYLKVGGFVNLERSMRLADRVGGHLVTGHVDGTALVTRAERAGECLQLEVSASPHLTKWTVPKGSVCLNGVSLTLNDLDRKQGKMSFLLVPETLRQTCFSEVSQGDMLNVECDQLVKIISEQMETMGRSFEHHP